MPQARKSASPKTFRVMDLNTRQSYDIDARDTAAAARTYFSNNNVSRPTNVVVRGDAYGNEEGIPYCGCMQHHKSGRLAVVRRGHQDPTDTYRSRQPGQSSFINYRHHYDE